MSRKGGAAASSSDVNQQKYGRFRSVLTCTECGALAGGVGLGPGSSFN